MKSLKKCFNALCLYNLKSSMAQCNNDPMAQFIRLAVNLQEGRNLDTPDIVAKRYIRQ